MLFSAQEYADLVLPLLNSEPSDAEEAVAKIAFSHLCEPSDILPGLLRQHTNLKDVLQYLIDRLDAQQVAGKLGPDVVTDIEDQLQNNFGVIWSNATERWTPRLSKAQVVESLAWMNAGAGGVGGKPSLCLFGSDDYPLAFEDLRFHQPPVLWLAGNLQLLSAEHLLSVVGTRQASRYGTEVTREIAAVAGLNDLPTVSGGAFGIDAVAHESAVALHAPTIAFMAGGLGNLYPRSNQGLLRAVSQSGLLVSESPPSVVPAKWRFLMRNRLIAALGSATVVVEAGKTSGALNTATTAVKLGRPVAIVPGLMSSARSIGCHDFLNRYPGEVQILARPKQVLELVGCSVAAEATVEKLGQLERRALDTFGISPVEVWEVQRLAGLTVRETQIALGSLEVLGLVQRIGGRYQRLLQP